MSEGNPYEAPKSSLDRSFKVKGKFAYRDGGHLIVREGFRAPRICVVTGKAVDQGAKGESVMLRSSKKSKFTSGLISGVVFLVIIVSLGISFEDLILFIPRSTFSVIIFAAFMIFIASFAFKPSGGMITVYCHSEVERKRRRFRFVTGFLGVVALIVYLGGNWFGLDLGSDVTMILVLGYVILSNFIKPRRLLKSLGREGDYERFNGAHVLFLEGLPMASDEENVALIQG